MISGLSLLEATKSSQSLSQSTKATILDCLGGEDVVSLGGDALGLHDGCQDLASPKGHLEDTCLDNGLGCDDGRALSNDLGQTNILLHRHS